jgi:hypothetical protein
MNDANKTICFAFVLVALALSSCGGGGPCGGVGQRCCGWPAASCGSGSSCQGGTCNSCGYAGGPCCSFNTCNTGDLFCNSPGGVGFVCQACGHIGQPACINNTCVTGVFSGGRCVAPGTADAMCNGSMSFVVGIRDGQTHCRVNEFAVRANNRDDARACAVRAARSAGFLYPEPTDATSWTNYPFTVTTSLGGCRVSYMPAYSVEDGEFCARAHFPDATIARGETCR